MSDGIEGRLESTEWGWFDEDGRAVALGHKPWVCPQRRWVPSGYRHGVQIPMMDQFDHEARALWHLELLGCHAPEDAVAPWVPPTLFDDDWDEDDDGYDCTRCGGEGFAEVDDPMWDECDEFGWGPCNACRGTGERRHQWVF